jgi:predicted alpha/beta superfamily hydrolase
MSNTPSATIFAVLVVCTGIGAPLSARAQAPAAPASRWAEMTLSSSALRGERKLFVATPFGYETSNRNYPVLVLLDANDAAQFNSAITTVRFLTDRQAIPPLVIVGVPNAEDRTRDLTPAATGRTAAAFPTAGGADKLLTFITREALPAARAKYRLTDYTILAGHSFGGLFALYVASTHPGSFPAIIAMSPSIWWNDSTPVKQYAEAIGQSRTPLRLFVANGAHEGSIDRPTSRFDKMLDDHHSPELSFSHTRYADASHNLVPISGLLDGLQFIFRPTSLAVTTLDDDFDLFQGDSARLVNTFRDFEQSFRQAVRSYPGPAIGVSDTLPEATLRTLAGATLDQLKMPGAASVLFARIVELFPTSARAHMGLARALVARADTAGAHDELIKARELAGSDSTLRKNVDARIRQLGRP